MPAATSGLEVLIVDDEPKQRRGLAALVRSLRPDYRVHEAKNGKEALEMTQSKALDIVFTDIQMPLMNGMEFLESLNTISLNRRTKVIFVSVFHEFGLAQQALRLGANDYLVKPVSTAHLEPLLEGLEQQIAKEISRNSEAEQLSNQLAHTKPVYVEHLAYKWMTEELQPSEQIELRSHLSFTGFGTVLIAETKSGTKKDSDREWKSMLKRAITQSLAPFANTLVLSPEHEKERLYTIIEWKDLDSSQIGLSRLRASFAQLENIYNRSVGVGIGLDALNLERDIRSCCESAKSALAHLYYSPEGMWVTALELDQLLRQAPVSTIAVKDTAALEEIVTAGQLEQACDALREMMERIASGYPTPFRMKCSAIQLLLTCMKRAELVIGDDMHRQLADRIDQEIMQADTLRETVVVALRLLTDIMVQMKKDKSSRSELIMQKCKEYLEDNLHEDLGLETVAQRFYYNSSYFSILFKNHFGQSFTDFLVKSRMQKARSMLLQSDLKVSDIAKQVGYKDIKYFNKVFKKMYLYPPDEFRRMFSS
ncbi:AraC family transcriptional regulator [Paenibacillus sp. CCS19]|uniref:response regulator transcription factor n=1 Tax=Paenibacillus sp. CCS19 TaxID=3158387 RepID=UPI0025632F8F|nr:response regulator [Paenibacillus cellulosilyticus]GMK42792.1 AraC family transcriptional regulator [Paenibacillus cellulosilyticus]